MSGMELEKRHLAQVIAVAKQQLTDARARAEKSGRAIADATRAMREEERRSLESLWGSDSFEEIAAISQLAEVRAADLSTREMLEARARMLAAMADRPYFARVDLTFDDGGDSEAIHIGRGTLKDEATHEIHVHDWRAPVASVFYRFGTGRFSYDAPGGAITGEMTRKRQYEIKNGELLYFFDADVRVEDEFLRAMLARSASPRMKAIVETIQSEQDAAIRDEKSDLLMVQGAAGSGKTSVALHRAAYLMYRDLKSPLAAAEILILSPNALFERYIGNVLPELTEERAQTASFEELLARLLGGARVERRSERFEALLADGTGARRERMAFLSSPAFRTILERYARELPARGIEYRDITLSGRVLFTREELRARVLKDGAHLPLAARLSRLESAVYDAARLSRPARMAVYEALARTKERHAVEVEECVRAYALHETELLARQMRAFTRLDPRALYERLLKELDPPKNMLAPADELPLEDAAAIAYLALLLGCADAAPRIRQVVVDEAQDYDPVGYALLGKLFPRARFTVLGDIRQALDREVGMDLYDEIERSLARRKSARVTLDKSFRCTKEILDYALNYLPDAAGIESFNRSGESPREITSRDAGEMGEQMKREIAELRASGMESVAVIAKTAREARAWSERLGIPLLDPDGGGEPTGAFVLPLALSKGLEFDAVLVPDAGEWGEGRLLYVACTRALHRLSLFSVERGEGA